MSLIFIECCVVWIPGLCCVDSSRSAVLDLFTEKKIHLANSILPLFQSKPTFICKSELMEKLTVCWLPGELWQVAGLCSIKQLCGRPQVEGRTETDHLQAQEIPLNHFWDLERSGVTSSGALSSSDVWVDFKACELHVRNACRKSPAASLNHQEVISSVQEIIFQLTDQAK